MADVPSNDSGALALIPTNPLQDSDKLYSLKDRLNNTTAILPYLINNKLNKDDATNTTNWLNGKIQDVNNRVDDTYNKINDNNNKIDNVNNSVNARINDIPGENMLDQTRTFGNTIQNNTYVGFEDAPEKCYPGFTTTRALGAWSDMSYVVPEDFMEIGKTYTISCWVRGDTEGDCVVTGFCPWSQPNMNPAMASHVKSTWERVSVTITASTPNFIYNHRIGIEVYNGTPGKSGVENIGALYVAGLKVEKGSVATDWCPSVNDRMLYEKDLKTYISDNYPNKTQALITNGDVIQSNTDLNTVIQPGVHSIDGATNLVNRPSGWSDGPHYGNLLVWNNPSDTNGGTLIINQMLTTNLDSSVYIRISWGAGSTANWNPWFELKRDKIPEWKQITVNTTNGSGHFWYALDNGKTTLKFRGSLGLNKGDVSNAWERWVNIGTIQEIANGSVVSNSGDVICTPLFSSGYVYLQVTSKGELQMFCHQVNNQDGSLWAPLSGQSIELFS